MFHGQLGGNQRLEQHIEEIVLMRLEEVRQPSNR